MCKPSFPKVAVRTDDSLISTATRVVVRTSSGDYDAEADVSKPNADLVSQGSSLRAKVDALVGPVLGVGEARDQGAVVQCQQSVERIADVLSRTTRTE